MIAVHPLFPLYWYGVHVFLDQHFFKVTAKETIGKHILHCKVYENVKYSQFTRLGSIQPNSQFKIVDVLKYSSFRNKQTLVIEITEDCASVRLQWHVYALLLSNPLCHSIRIKPVFCIQLSVLQRLNISKMMIRLHVVNAQATIGTVHPALFFFHISKHYNPRFALRSKRLLLVSEFQ